MDGRRWPRDRRRWLAGSSTASSRSGRTCRSRGRARRPGHRTLPARVRADRPAAERGLVRPAGREGAALAAGARPAAPAADPGPGGRGGARRRLSPPRSVYRWLDVEPALVVPVGDLDGLRDCAGPLPERARPVDATGGPEPESTTSSAAARWAPTRARRWRRSRRSATRSRAMTCCASGRTPCPRRGTASRSGSTATSPPETCSSARAGGRARFGSSVVGDPACDMVIAWTFLSGASRDRFRRRARRRSGHLVAWSRLARGRRRSPCAARSPPRPAATSNRCSRTPDAELDRQRRPVERVERALDRARRRR